MDKIEYLKISQNKGLPSRCPILDYCLRRAYTIYFYSEYKEEDFSNDIIETLIKAGEVPNDFMERLIRMSGEVPNWSKGKGIGWFTGMCPEVNMFDTSNSLNAFSKTACSDGSWDNENDKKIIISEEKHYSECSEFSKHLFENKTIKETFTAKNKVIECYTYLMIDNKTGHHKIGISSSPNYREKTLQSEQPTIEKIISRKFQNRKLARDLELELHNKYDYKRTRGEWFDLNPMEIKEIVQILSE